MDDPHFLLGVFDVPEHLSRDHLGHRNAQRLTDTVTDADLAAYRREVADEEDDDDEVLRFVIVHDRIHELVGDH